MSDQTTTTTETLYETLWGDIAPLPASAGHVDLAKPPRTYAEERAQERERARARRKARTQAGNPMIAKHGRDADGHTCGECLHLLRERHNSQLYYKCELFGRSRGDATDFRIGWPSCRKFEPRPEGTPWLITVRKKIVVACPHLDCTESIMLTAWRPYDRMLAHHPVRDPRYPNFEHGIAVTIAPDGSVLSLEKAW